MKCMKERETPAFELPEKRPMVLVNLLHTEVLSDITPLPKSDHH